MPRFISTRGDAPPVSFEDALLEGLAPDGGLFVPASIPQPDSISQVASAHGQKTEAFSELAARVLAPWLEDEIPSDVLRSIAAEALAFPVPLVSLPEAEAPEVRVLELFRGPTLSFKDFGAGVMARCLTYFMRERADHLVILVATSGDTGSAVAEGFAGQAGISVVLLYPKDQVSPVQERQLVAERPGVHAFAVEGTFDDCQRLVKAAFQDPDLASFLLSSANSINVGRLLPQMLYYAWSVQQMGHDDVVFCVPSGNLGNLTGGVLARLGGLPVRRFIAAHNANDFFPRYLAGAAGDFDESQQTLSNAMDVGAPSNFERLRWLLSNEQMRRWIWGTSVSDEATLRAMRRVYETTGYVADPHTAVGFEAVRRYRQATGDDTPAVVLATAHPAKFPSVVEQALGFAPEAPERLSALWNDETRVEALAPTLEAFKEEISSVQLREVMD